MKKPEIGERFGKRTVISIEDDYVVPSTGQHKQYVSLQCDCGKISRNQYANLVFGKSVQCKSCSNSIKSSNHRKDFTGLKVGKLTAIRPTEKKNGSWHWIFRCDCGNEIEAIPWDVKKLSYISCGKCLGKRRRTEYSRYRKTLQSPEQIYLEYLRRAKQRSQVFDEDIKDLFIAMLSSPCVHCGISPSLGIDRINSDLGYIIGNIQPCCERCNQMKMAYSDQEFYDHCIKVIEYQRSK